MKIYLASRYSRRLELIEYRCELQEMGHVVTSRWLNGQHQIDKTGVPIGDKGEQLVEGDSGENSLEAARLRTHFVTEDVYDVNACDILISFTEPPRTALGNRGGRHIEFGLALGIGRELIVVGYRENLFHWLPCVKFFPLWEQAKESLSDRDAGSTPAGGSIYATKN